jgi:hypothetical protein
MATRSRLAWKLRGQAALDRFPHTVDQRAGVGAAVARAPQRFADARAQCLWGGVVGLRVAGPDATPVEGVNRRRRQNLRRRRLGGRLRRLWRRLDRRLRRRLARRLDGRLGRRLRGRLGEPFSFLRLGQRTLAEVRHLAPAHGVELSDDERDALAAPQEAAELARLLERM